MFGGPFGLANQYKRSIVLNLKDQRDRARCLELARDADVFVEGYRPGVADRLGVGYDAAGRGNARLVYCSLSGDGAYGGLAEGPGHDVTYRAYTGAPPPAAGSPDADERAGADMGAATNAA